MSGDWVDGWSDISEEDMAVNTMVKLWKVEDRPAIKGIIYFVQQLRLFAPEQCQQLFLKKIPFYFYDEIRNDAWAIVEEAIELAKAVNVVYGNGQHKEAYKLERRATLLIMKKIRETAGEDFTGDWLYSAFYELAESTLEVDEDEKPASDDPNNMIDDIDDLF